MIHLKHEDCLGFFSEILRVLTSTNQHEEVFHLVVDRIVRIFKCQTCAIVTVDPSTEYLHVENSFGLSHTYTKDFRRKLATGSIGRLLWSGNPILITDSEADPQLTREVQMEHTMESCICVPIVVDHRTLGYLYADHRQKHGLTSEDSPFIMTFARLAGLALNKSRMFEENLHLDRIDHETELEKYGPFLERLNENVERAQKFGESFSVMLLDVDNYKHIALTYGYDSAKDLLRGIASQLKSHLRTIDDAGRFGFDELIVLKANMPVKTALIEADELRKAIEEGSQTEKNIKTTVSIGVASFPEQASNSDELLTTVKRALFEAQRGGRNRVHHCHEEMEHRDMLVHEDEAGTYQ
jgi:diguanylate cyclase (GGDEF)-like protein